MNIENISEQEYKQFNEQLNQTFEFHINGSNHLPPKEQIELLGVRLYSKNKAADITSIKGEDIRENEFYFYSKTKKAEIFNFWKHLRNCSSHKNRIKQLIKDEVKYYYFEDKWRSDFTMKGLVRVDNWNEFIESLINISI